MTSVMGSMRSSLCALFIKVVLVLPRWICLQSRALVVCQFSFVGLLVVVYRDERGPRSGNCLLTKGKMDTEPKDAFGCVPWY